MLKKFVLIIALLYAGATAKAQVTEKETTSSVVVKKKHSPRRAAIYSALLPGAGQAYNRKYWKVPLVYASMGISIYLSQSNRESYLDYRDVYRAENDDDSTTVSRFHEKILNNTVTLDGIKDLRDTYRSWMELSYIFAGLFYVLQVVDASVDAHFMEFDVSDDLTLNVEPRLLNFSGRNQQNFAGVSLRLTLK